MTANKCNVTDNAHHLHHDYHFQKFHESLLNLTYCAITDVKRLKPLMSAPIDQC
jgi:hypothetical protein